MELNDLKPFQEGFKSAELGRRGAAGGNGKAAMELQGQWGPGTMQANTADKKGR